MGATSQLEHSSLGPLARVASLLRERDDVGSLSNGHKQRSRKLFGLAPWQRKLSKESNDSISSSIRDLIRGHTPNVSPASDNATVNSRNSLEYNELYPGNVSIVFLSGSTKQVILDYTMNIIAHNQLLRKQDESKHHLYAATPKMAVLPGPFSWTCLGPRKTDYHLSDLQRHLPSPNIDRTIVHLLSGEDCSLSVSGGKFQARCRAGKIWVQSRLSLTYQNTYLQVLCVLQTKSTKVVALEFVCIMDADREQARQQLFRDFLCLKIIFHQASEILNMIIRDLTHS